MKENEEIKVFVQEVDGKKVVLNNEEVLDLINNQKTSITNLSSSLQTSQIMTTVNDKEIALTNEQIVNLLQKQQETIKQLQENGPKITGEVNGEKKTFTVVEILDILQKQQVTIQELSNQLIESSK